MSGGAWVRGGMQVVGPALQGRIARSVEASWGRARMAFPSHILDDLRDRVPLSDLVGRRVKLIKRGREFTGLCPFHNEKTPSFTISDDKGFYHCFGCGAHGSVFDFLMRTEGLGFVEAVEKIADLTGVKLPPRSADDRERTEQRMGLLDLTELVAGWFESQLGGQGGKPARDYLASRGLDDGMIENFRVGFAPPSRTALKEAMLARSVNEDALIEAGLLIKPEDGGATYDRFRNRIIFPIADRRGRVIAFGGRALGDGKPKYINSPDTPLFHKGRTLFGLARSREAARAEASVVVVEGYMDVIALAAVGLDHAVAPLGTAITGDQIRELWRLAPEPVLCLDGDEAGLRAAVSAADRALPLLKPGYSLRFALLPAGEDPDSLVRQGGAAALKPLLDDALPLADVLWRNAVNRRTLDTPERRAALERELSESVGRIGDATVRGYYRDYVNQRLGDMFGDRRTPPAPRSGTPGRRRGGRGFGRRLVGPKEGPSYRRERLLAVTILHHPELLDRRAEDFAEVPLTDAALDGLRTAILEIAGSMADLDSAALKYHLTDRGYAAILEKIAGPAALLDWFARPEAASEDAEKGWTHALARHQRAVKLPEELEAAQRAFAADPNTETQAQLLALKREEELVEGNEAQLEQFGVASGRKVML